MMSNVSEDLDIGVQEYVAHLQSDYDSKGGNQFIEFKYELGRKYIHVIMNHIGQFSVGQRSSHSWIMIDDDKKFKRGDILKSASWRAPARNFARANVLKCDYSNIRWCGV
jgi:hypothetical protein